MTSVADPAPAISGDDPAGGPDHAGTARRLLRGASWSFLAQTTPVVISLVMTPFLIHHLGLELFGLSVLASTVISLLRTFDGGLAGTAIRFFAIQAGAERRDETTRLLTSLVTLVLVVGGLIGAVAELLVPAIIRAFGVTPSLRGEGIFQLRVLIVLVVLGVAAGLFSSVLSARQRFAWLSCVSVMGTALSAVGFVIALELGYSLRALALITAGQTVLSILLTVPVACRWLDRGAVGFASRAELREFWRFAWRTQLVSIGSLINLESDSFIVGVARGPSQVGFYSVGAGFALQLRQVVLNGLGPIASQLGRAFGARGLAATEEFEALQRVWVIGTTAWCAACLGSAYVAMTVWLGPAYGITGYVATVLGFANMINLWTGVTTVWLQSAGYPAAETRYGVLGVALNVVLTAALVVPLGLYGIMIGTAVGQGVASLYLLRIIRRQVPIPVRSFLLDVPWLSGLLCAGVTLAVEFAARPVLPRGPIGLICCGALTLPGFGVFLLRERSLVAAVRMGLGRGSRVPA